MQQPEDLPIDQRDTAKKSVDSSVDSFIATGLIVFSVILFIVPFGILLTPITIYGAYHYHRAAKQKAGQITSYTATSKPGASSAKSPAGLNAPIIALLVLLVGGAAFMSLLFNGLT